MSEKRAIQIWLHDDVPSKLAGAIPNFNDTVEPTGFCVCHVPKAVVESEDYQMTESLPPLSIAHGLFGDERIKLLPMTGNYLFGTNACDVLDHPEGDGLLIVFSNI